MDSGLIVAITAFIAVILILTNSVKFLLKVQSKLGLFSLSIFFLILTIIVFFLDSFFPGASENPIIQILLQFKGVLFGILGFFLAFLTISYLHRTHDQNSKPCNSGYVPIANYEPFANANQQSIVLIKLIRQANQILEQIQTATEDMSQMVEDACSLQIETRQKYIDANAEEGEQPKEYTDCITRTQSREECEHLKLSSDKMDKRNARKNNRANRMYEDEKARVVSGPMLECFENPEDEDAAEIAELEDELRSVLGDIDSYIQSAEYDKIIAQCSQIQNTMTLVLALTKKGKKKTDEGKEKQEEAQEKKQEEESKFQEEEGFQDMGSGNTLIANANSIFTKAQTLLVAINTAKVKYTVAKAEYDALQGKVNRMVSGEPTQEDIIKGPTFEQGACPAYMFEIAKDAGGYCCPDEPSNYNSERGQYLECSPPTDDALKKRKKRFNAAINKCGNNDDACISNTRAVFNQGPGRQTMCRLPENPRETDAPVCTYICSKTGKPCSFAEFKAE